MNTLVDLTSMMYEVSLEILDWTVDLGYNFNA